MRLICALLLGLCLGLSSVDGQFRGRSRNPKPTIGEIFPYGRTCSLRYDYVLKPSTWICNDPKYKDYPETDIDKLKSANAEISEFLKITKSCYSFHDIGGVEGKTPYYTYRSLCKTIRTPINVLWAQVPGYVPKAAEMSLNGGLLPVNVVKGQNLYDVTCEHPMASKPTKNLSKREKLTDWHNLRRYCWIGYSYNSNYVCKPSGHINRSILVYSRHANLLFYMDVEHVPTSCACTICRCKPTGRRRRPRRRG